jgi:hypothetical protein
LFSKEEKNKEAGAGISNVKTPDFDSDPLILQHTKDESTVCLTIYTSIFVTKLFSVRALIQ